jgi:hypothetical protein
MLSITASRPENRRCKRSKTIRAGRIVFNNKQCVVGCTVRDLSETGARLEVPSVLDLPREFELIVTNGPTRGCNVVWGASTLIGVRFVDREASARTIGPTEAAAATHDLRSLLLARIEHLQTQLDEVRAQVVSGGKDAGRSEPR